MQPVTNTNSSQCNSIFFLQNRNLNSLILDYFVFSYEVKMPMKPILQKHLSRSAEECVKVSSLAPQKGYRAVSGCLYLLPFAVNMCWFE